MEFGTISPNRQRRAMHVQLPNPKMPKPASNEKNLLQQMQSQPGGRPENRHNRRCPMLNRSRRNQRGPNRQSNQQFHQRDCAGTAGTRDSKRATPHGAGVCRRSFAARQSVAFARVSAGAFMPGTTFRRTAARRRFGRHIFRMDMMQATSTRQVEQDCKHGHCSDDVLLHIGHKRVSRWLKPISSKAPLQGRTESFYRRRPVQTRQPVARARHASGHTVDSNRRKTIIESRRVPLTKGRPVSRLP